MTKLAETIGLLRAHTAHDFALYKEGTLLRRIENFLVPWSLER